MIYEPFRATVADDTRYELADDRLENVAATVCSEMHGVLRAPFHRTGAGCCAVSSVGEFTRLLTATTRSTKWPGTSDSFRADPGDPGDS